MQSNLKQHFYTMILTFIIATVIITLMLAVIQQKSGISFEKIVFPQFAPAMAILVLFLIFHQLPTSLNFQVDKNTAIKTLIAFLLPLVIFSLVYFIGNKSGWQITFNENVKKMVLASVPGMLIGAFAEEIGWRSFLQPALDEKYTAYLASVITGIVWGLWHIGHYKNGLIYMIGFVLFTIAASLILSRLLAGMHYNLLIAGIFHFAVNLGFALFFSKVLTESKLMILNSLIWCGFATGIIILSEKKMLPI